MSTTFKQYTNYFFIFCFYIVFLTIFQLLLNNISTIFKIKNIYRIISMDF
nr:MAG TPA: hypothetical protein [Caudoviricetes sp.]